MAVSTLSGDAAYMSLECSICFLDFNQPKTLPCQHTFCLKCLKNYCGMKSKTGTRPCPICRIAFTIPQGGVVKLPNNDSIMTLLEMKQAEAEQKCISSERKKKSVSCELCAVVGENIKAQAYCNECKQSLCLRCKKMHAAQAFSKTHNVVGLKERKKEERLLNRELSYCSKHSKQKLYYQELYCCDCNLRLCCVCQLESHEKHNCSALLEVVKQKKEAFVKDEFSIRRCYDIGCDEVKNLKHERERTVLEASEAVHCIEEAFNKSVKHLETFRDKLFEDVEAMKMRRLKQIESQEDLNQLHCRELDSFLACSRMVMERGTDCEIIQASDELHRRAEELIKSQDEHNKKQLPYCSIKFAPSSAPTPKQVRKVFGKLLDTDKSKWIIHTNIEVEEEITGVTVLNDMIFVIIYGQSNVSVYDLYSGKSKPDIYVPSMNSPHGILGCSLNNSLYISNWVTEHICRVNLTDNSFKRWSLSENNGPYGLSLTPEHNLLVTVQIKNAGGQSRVLEYTTEGQLIREIELDRSIEEAWQTVQLSADQFVISHGYDSSVHRFCIIDNDGKIIKSYSKEDESGEYQLDIPHSVTVDSKSGKIFVADSSNHRVLKFNRDLTFLGQVQTHDELSVPWSVFFDSSTDRLFIGDWGLGRVLIVYSSEL